METNNADRIEKIHGSGYRAALVVTGGGTGALHALLSHPGAARFVLEAQVPYSLEAMFDYLGETLDQYCSETAAEILAARAYERAMVFSLTAGSSLPILGIACTAALQTIRERRGADRAYACIKSRDRLTVRSLEVPMAPRAAQEDALSRALLDMVLEFVA